MNTKCDRYNWPKPILHPFKIRTLRMVYCVSLECGMSNQEGDLFPSISFGNVA